jgi:hypothetical protein
VPVRLDSFARPYRAPLGQLYDIAHTACNECGVPNWRKRPKSAGRTNWSDTLELGREVFPNRGALQFRTYHRQSGTHTTSGRPTPGPLTWSATSGPC